MKSFLNFRRSIPSIGLHTRRVQSGPERSMVKKFIEQYVERNKSKNYNLAVFQEPLIETGFPDLVFAQYDPRIFDRWSLERFDLKIEDIKLLHFLFTSNGAESDRIKKQLGIRDVKLLRSIERLLDAKLIIRTSGHWKTVDTDSIFALRQLVAVEAKIADTSAVVNQARANMWYASESYILSPLAKPTEDFLASLRLYGVGIYSFKKDKVIQLQPSLKTSIPSSYLSWVFNEWVGRKINNY